MKNSRVVEDKGKYYHLILKVMGIDHANGIISKIPFNYLYPGSIKGIYDTFLMYFTHPEKVDKEEFIFSMNWVLADVFGDGSEVEVPDGTYDFLYEE